MNEPRREASPITAQPDIGVWIELRKREPGGMERRIFGVPRPRLNAERDAVLVDVVRRVVPEARLVSLGGGVARFTGERFSVRAWFGRVGPDTSIEPLETDEPPRVAGLASAEEKDPSRDPTHAATARDATVEYFQPKLF
jgi:hypothetical protein